MRTVAGLHRRAAATPYPWCLQSHSHSQTHSHPSSTMQFTNHHPLHRPHSGPSTSPAPSPGPKQPTGSGWLTTTSTPRSGTVSPVDGVISRPTRSSREIKMHYLIGYQKKKKIDKNIHESCTRMNTNTVLTSGDCAYWTNPHGGMGHGCIYVYIFPLLFSTNSRGTC